MHALTILFTPLALHGLVYPVVSLGPTIGHLCCSGGVADPSNTCKGKGLNSFCCTALQNNIFNGCDPIKDFPTGRFVADFVPNANCTFPSVDVPSETATGFIGCA
ncbi:hypothetical protein LX36DRAFT_646580 [Colletotrichum falcatum]|nr:hypothetical protein LX36DRAFT_646580 [Colletotrichum falcatum]